MKIYPLMLNKLNNTLNGKPVEQNLIEWFETLEKQRGQRAELRRASTPTELFMCAGFHRLAYLFRPWLNQSEYQPEWRWQALALVAGALSHINEIETTSSCFMAQLGHKVDDRPALSELRFTRLQQAHDHEEFYRLLIRAIRQLKGKVNLLSLVDDILLWCREQHDLSNNFLIERKPFDRPQLRWARQYFDASEPTKE